jgi:hypothetical protein
MLVAFLQQLLTFGGFYDEGREFLRVERVQASAHTHYMSVLMFLCVWSVTLVTTRTSSSYHSAAIDTVR